MGCKVDHRGIYASETSGACLFICFSVIIIAHLLLWLSSLSLYAYCGRGTRQTISFSEEKLRVLICSLNHLFIRSLILCHCHCCKFAVVVVIVISLRLPLPSPLVGLWERYKADYIISFRKRYFRLTSDTYFFLASAILVFICASALASDAAACTFLSSTFSRKELH